jgi:hypothetical protein
VNLYGRSRTALANRSVSWSGAALAFRAAACVITGAPQTAHCCCPAPTIAPQPRQSVGRFLSEARLAKIIWFSVTAHYSVVGARHAVPLLHDELLKMGKGQTSLAHFFQQVHEIVRMLFFHRQNPFQHAARGWIVRVHVVDHFAITVDGNTLGD